MFLRPSKLVKALGLPLVCLAMFSVAGGHWAVLQGVAWSQMLWQYSKDTGSLVIGAKKTFSGDYPCDMCRKVVEGQKKEEQAPATFKADKKAEGFVVAATEILPLHAHARFSYPSTNHLVGPVRFDCPPGPVPRAVLPSLA